MSSKDAHLYGARPKGRTKAKEISSSSSLAFSSTLSNLIKNSSTESNKPTAGRARPQKEDIFKTHNKNVRKRALKDLEDTDFTQKHRGRTTEEKGEDEVAWKRTKRRMEEKARLYDALKRGDVEDIDDRYGVDFDRKWAEQQEKGARWSPRVGPRTGTCSVWMRPGWRWTASGSAWTSSAAHERAREQKLPAKSVESEPSPPTNPTVSPHDLVCRPT